MNTPNQSGPVPVDLPIKILAQELAEELRGGEDIALWVEELRRTYPQNSPARTLSSY